MIYANNNWLNNKMDYNQIKQYHIWYAQYLYKPGTHSTWTNWSITRKPTFKKHIDMWQFTSSGNASGIRGRVDLNKTYAEF